MLYQYIRQLKEHKKKSYSGYTSTENVRFCGIGTRFKRSASLTPTLLISLPSRSRNAGYPAPPAQIRTGAANAYGSYLEYLA